MQWARPYGCLYPPYHWHHRLPSISGNAAAGNPGKLFKYTRGELAFLEGQCLHPRLFNHLPTKFGGIGPNCAHSEGSEGRISDGRCSSCVSWQQNGWTRKEGGAKKRIKKYCDYELCFKVNQETGEALAQRWGCEFVETSAKQGKNVTEWVCH